MSDAAHAVVQDLPASWEGYLDALAPLRRRPPAGLLFLVAGRTDEGIRAISLWESGLAWERFQDDRLPALLAGIEPARAIETTNRRLVVQHLLVPRRPTGS